MYIHTYIHIDGIAQIIMMSRTRRMCRLLIDCSGSMTSPSLEEGSKPNIGETDEEKQKTQTSKISEI